MDRYTLLKYKVHKACLEHLTSSFKSITERVKSIKDGLHNETKSSAGDKHETGRAMMQLEMEKMGAQMKVLNGMKLTMEQIDLKKDSSAVALGSLVKTTKGDYYVAISVGKIEVDDYSCFAISAASPLGQEMLGKRAGDHIANYDTHILHVT